MAQRKTTRPDQWGGAEEGIYRKNKKILIRRADVCAICGGYINKELKFPNPYSASVDHIVPVSKGGKSDMSNLQVAHLICNQNKGANLQTNFISARQYNLPQYIDWGAL